MLTQTDHDAIIKNSAGNLYFFYLDSNTVKYEVYSNNQVLLNTSALTEFNIVSFSVDIDKNDRIHLLCFTDEGKLIYYMYLKDKWSNSIIANLDTKSNSYDNILLKVNNDNVHILYAYSNLINSSVWTIQHIMSVKNQWQKMNAISIATGKSAPYFNIDLDKFQNIHMVYKAKSAGKENIYYTCFNFPLNKWSKFPQQISDSIHINTNPYVFADRKDNIHIVWCKSLKNEVQLAYKRLSSFGNNKFIWKQEPLPAHRGNISTPLIYEKNGVINILFDNNNVLTGIYSKDSGLIWKSNNMHATKGIDKLRTIQYSSNYHIEKSSYKINHLFINVEESFIQLPEKFLSKKANLNVEKFNSQYSYKEQNEVAEQPSQINSSSILENLDDLNDELVKDFVTDIKNDFEVTLSKHSEIRELKANLEKIILNNSLHLDEKIGSYNNRYKEIINELNNLKNVLEQCRNENNELLSIIDSAKKITLSRESTIELISSKISQINDILIKESNRSIFKKILSVFKKDT